MKDLYKNINDVISAYYITNEDVLDPKEKAKIKLTNLYTELWYRSESEFNTIYGLLEPIVPTLATKVECMWNKHICLNSNAMKLAEQLHQIDDELVYHETVNFGFGSKARKLRKRWRKTKRTLYKSINNIIKNHIRKVKEI